LTSKAHFEAGVSLERGFRHLVVSFLPPKLLRIINFLGYEGVRNIAFAELNKTAFELPGIYSIISELVLIGYWIYIETHGCFGPKNVTFFEKLIEKKLEVYPNVFINEFFEKKHQQKSNLFKLFSEPFISCSKG
jgi:hypothetical protein